MFKKIQIELTDPICDCDTQNLSWGITAGPGIFIKCKECETQINVSAKKFVACYKLDKKYPKYKCDKCDKLHDTGLTHDQATIKEIIE